MRRGQLCSGSRRGCMRRRLKRRRSWPRSRGKHGWNVDCLDVPFPRSGSTTSCCTVRPRPRQPPRRGKVAGRCCLLPKPGGAAARHSRCGGGARPRRRAAAAQAAAAGAGVRPNCTAARGSGGPSRSRRRGRDGCKVPLPVGRGGGGCGRPGLGSRCRNGGHPLGCRRPLVRRCRTLRLQPGLQHEVIRGCEAVALARAQRATDGRRVGAQLLKLGQHCGGGAGQSEQTVEARDCREAGTGDTEASCGL